MTAYIEYINTALRVGKESKALVVDLFAGCGGLALGFEAQGFKTIGFEMNPDACQSYEMNLKRKCHQVFLTPTTPLPFASVIIGGPPCQPFSVGGYQMGLQDSRDGFPAFIAAIARVQPDIWLFENVRGLLYQNKWYLHEITRTLRSLGYIVESRLANMVDYNVPQNRERIVVVGHRGQFKFPEPVAGKVSVGEALLDTATLAPPESKYLTESMDRYVENYERASKCIVPRDLHLNKPSRTLTCRNLAGATGDMMRLRLPDGRRRRLLVREGARLQSFPDWFQFAGTETSQFNQIGNAVSPLFAYHLANSVNQYLNSTYRMSPSEVEAYNHSVDVADHTAQLAQQALFNDSSTRTSHALPIMKGTFMTEQFLYDQPQTGKKLARKPTTEEFLRKTPENQALINEMLFIMSAIGLPVHRLSPRRMEKMAMTVLALAHVEARNNWPYAKDLASGHHLTTRACIDYINMHFGETISRGSYDNIRRKDLVWPLIRGLVVPSKDVADDNDGTRGYAINPLYINILRTFGQDNWVETIRDLMRDKPTLDETLKVVRNIPRTSVLLPGDTELQFADTQHNRLQKAIIELFLPIWGQEARVLYVGDTSDRDLHLNEDALEELNIPKPDRAKLPDIIAYSSKANRLYLIEAVHSSGPISNERRHALEALVRDTPAYVVYITAFQTWDKFRQHAPSIGWETEVWVAEAPEHLIHYNGEKFLPKQ